MKYQFLKGFVLLSFVLSPLYGDEIENVSLRFHAQWDLGERDKQRLQEKYGASRVKFTAEGKAVPQGLVSEKLTRWRRLYELCMSDGCYYCDADEGSCETGTCGLKNAYCKPYLGSEGLPSCGFQCADYAFMSTLP